MGIDIVPYVYRKYFAEKDHGTHVTVDTAVTKVANSTGNVAFQVNSTALNASQTKNGTINITCVTGIKLGTSTTTSTGVVTITPSAIGAAASSHGTHVGTDTCVTSLGGGKGDITLTINGASKTASSGSIDLGSYVTTIGGKNGAISIKINNATKSADNSGVIDLGSYLTGITSAMITTALGYTPRNPADDADTWRPVVDNLTSTDTDKSLTANQGKVLKGYIDTLNSHGHIVADSSVTNKSGNVVLEWPSDPLCQYVFSRFKLTGTACLWFPANTPIGAIWRVYLDAGTQGYGLNYSNAGDSDSTNLLSAIDTDEDTKFLITFINVSGKFQCVGITGLI